MANSEPSYNFQPSAIVAQRHYGKTEPSMQVKTALGSATIKNATIVLPANDHYNKTETSFNK